MSGYTKLFNSILDSTIWQESNETRLLWITMLAMSDKRGEVLASIPGLAKRAGISLPDCERALTVLLSPDPYSRTEDYEGRRIEAVDGGWILLNHAKYRDLLSLEERREYNRKKQAEHRKRSQSKDVNDMSITVNHNKQCQHITEADTEADTDNKKKNPPKSPKGESRQAAQELPDSFSEASKQAISEWETFRREIKKPLTPSTRQKVIEAMTADPAGTIASINRSITNGWQGLFPDNDTRAVMRQQDVEPKKSTPKQSAPDGWQAVYATIDADPVYSDGEYCCPDWERLSPAERSEVTRKMAAMPSESPQRGFNGSGNIRTAEQQIEAAESKMGEKVTA